LSRPQEVLGEQVIQALNRLEVEIGSISRGDIQSLCAVSPLLLSVRGGMIYRVENRGHQRILQVGKRFGCSEGKKSRYDKATKATGSERTTLRLQRIVWGIERGARSDEAMLFLPVFRASDSRFIERLVLLCVQFVARAPLPQKVHVLDTLRPRREELIEVLEELGLAGNLHMMTEHVSPRDLVAAPVHVLAQAVSGPREKNVMIGGAAKNVGQRDLNS